MTNWLPASGSSHHPLLLYLQAISLSLLWLLLLIPEVFAEEIGLPGHYYGMLNYPLNQSIHSTLALKLEEKTFSQRNTFELLANIPKADKFRIAGEPIGRLDLKLLYPDGHIGADSCTATVLSRIYIITNFHCLPGTRRDIRVVLAHLEMAYYSKDMPETERVRLQVSTSPVENNFNEELDYSILKTDAPIPEKFVLPRTKFREPIEGETLYMIHHPMGEAKRLSSYDCRVATQGAVEGTTVFHRCDSMPGSSGALLFSATDDSIIGIHYSEDGGRNLNRATRFSLIRNNSDIVRSIAMEVPRPEHVSLNITPYNRLDINTLMNAIRRRDIELVNRHIRSQVTLNEEVYGSSPIAAAVQEDSFDILNLLLANGAKPGPANKAGNLFHIFVNNSNSGKGDLRILKALLDLKIPVNIPDDSNLTAVCKAKRSTVIDLFYQYRSFC